jgi:DUF4097 and DUF4098 domain-containing protein YvlB
MKRFLFAFAPFALVTLGVVGVRAAQDETERVSRTLTLEPGGTLKLKSFSGRVNIEATDGNQVVIEAVRRATRERLDHIKLDIHAEGRTVFVDANHRDSSWWSWNDNVVHTDFDIKVPQRTSMDVNVFSAAVTIRGVDGTHRVGGFSSRLELDDVSGSIRAHTFSGPVEIQAKEWRDNQDVDVDTFSGNVTLRVPETARGLVTFNSFSGHLNSELPLTLRDGNRRSLKAELGSGGRSGGSLRFKTFSGSVRIDR